MEVKRPLKRSKLGLPDVYKQEAKQNEDILSEYNLKHGFSNPPPVENEFGSCKHQSLDAFGVYFSALLSEKHRISTLKHNPNKKQLVNSKELFLVHHKTMNAVEAWFRGLSSGEYWNTPNFFRRIPIFSSKDQVFKILYEIGTPLSKGVYFFKMAAHQAQALSESSSKQKKRQTLDQCQELTSALIKYLQCMQEDISLHYNQWQYQTQLARHLFDEGLLDQHDFLCFLLELIEKKRPINDVFVKFICPLIQEYVIDFSKSAVLSRRLAHVCAKKLCSALHHHPMSVSRSTMRKNELAQQQQIGNTTNSNSMARHLMNNNFVDSLLSADQENNQENNLYKSAIYILSSILQAICIECPTAMVRHHIVDAKFSPMFQGSPLDHLPCLPSSLPMIESDLNFELRKAVHDAEREILHRSAMADSKWSCDRSSRAENSKGSLVNRLLTVMDILDKHNFDKIDAINSIDILYSKIFPSIDNNNSKQPTPDTSNTLSASNSSGVLDLSSTSANFSQTTDHQSKKSKQLDQQTPVQNFCEEHVIKFLCEWATTTQRTGEHRALVVARLLEKRQADLQVTAIEAAKLDSSIMKSTKKNKDLKPPSNSANSTNDLSKISNCVEQEEDDDDEEVVHYTFQNVLVQFLDENAPVIEENPEDVLDNKKAFNNLVFLFSELIRCDVFSHYNYMCTLISRGMFNDLSKSSSCNPDLSNIDSPAPGSNLNQPGSVKPPPKSIGKESDSILASTIQGLTSNPNIYPLTVTTNTGNHQSNHPDSMSNSKLVGSSNADQSLRSLGFSPVSSQQNVSQNLDKGHGPLDNHFDDVDADLGKILQDIKEGQQDEAADILLPDYLGGGGLREESSNKNPQINKLSPFGLGDRSSALDNPTQNTSNVLSNSNFPTNPVESKPVGINQVTTAAAVDEKSIKNPSEHRHMTFVKHFPVPDDENFIHDVNQRNFLLYGFGKEREDVKHTMKRLNKEICKLFSRRASRDINEGGKIKKAAIREGFNPESALHKFESLNHHDQHVITNSLSATILEMYTGVSNGQTFFLPSLESLSFVFDLFTMALNVSGLLELVVPILEELPDIEAQIKLKCPILANQYTHSIALCIIGMLYRYHNCLLLLSKDELCSIFESLYKLVAHIQSPGVCTTSSEKVIYHYLYDLYSSQSGRFFDQFSNIVIRIRQALQNTASPSNTNIEHEWIPTFLANIVNQLKTSHLYSNSSTNPILIASSCMTPNSNFSQVKPDDITVSIRQQLYMHDSATLRQLNESSAFRYRFVCDAIYLSATSTFLDLVNDIAVLCADVTVKCPALAYDWITALQNLFCSAQRELSYRLLVSKINILDPQVMDNIAIFTAILVARRCLDFDLLLKCAIASIISPTVHSLDKQSTEPGIRLTCHLLLTLFRDRESPISQARSQSSLLNAHNSFNQTFSNLGGSTPNYGGGLLSAVPNMGLLQPINREQDNIYKSPLYLKYLCDHHLLRSACCSIKTECHITLLKAIRAFAMWASPSSDPEAAQSRIKTENHFEDVGMDGMRIGGKDLELHDGSPSILNLEAGFNLKHINLQKASLHEFADAILRLLCSQRWLHGKCLSDSEIFTNTENNILIDPRLDIKQSQRLLYMICYNKSPEKQADVGLDELGSDQVASIVQMFENLDVWSMRLSLMRLQFMFAYCKSQSNTVLNEWLDNLAKAVVDFFQKASQENEINEKDNAGEDASDFNKKSKSSKATSCTASSITNINKVWLIEPLLDKLTKLPSAVQSKIIKASAALMESASVRANSLPSLNQTYLSTAAASTKFKERTLSQRGSALTNPSNLASTSLLGFQPFLSLLLSCLKNQDKERETLLTSLNSQLYQAIHEKVDDIGYKQSLQDGLELRLCLIGQMFDTIQRSSNLTSDWATLLLLLIMNNLVDPQVDYGLYVSVLDMLAMLIHSAYASDPIEQKEESKKQYQNLMKKFRKELAALEEKGFIQMKLISHLMPLVRQMTEVITCEPMGSLVDTKGEKVENFYSIDKKKGLKVSELQEVSPWDLIEGHKNPSPLSWPWFGAIRLEQKPLRADENNRLMSWHTHTVRHSTAYFCQVPNTDDGPPSAKRSNNEKKPSQSNPLLKSLIEASDESSLLSKKENDSTTNLNDDDAMSDTNEYFIGKDDLLEDYCELPIDLLFDPTPIETMIEDIKTAMQAEHAAMSSRAKPQIVDTKPQASSILAPVQPDANHRSTTPQVSALSALQNQLNASNMVESAILVNSSPASVPPLSMSPIVNPHTPEVIPARPPSNISKITPTPSPIGVANRSMSPIVARSPVVLPTPPPPPKPRAPRKKRVTKKDANANALIDANANIPNTTINKNPSQINMLPSTVTSYASGMDNMSHHSVPPPPQMIVNQAKLAPNSQPGQVPMHQIQQQQQAPGMIVRRGPLPQQIQQQQQQASVYDFPYQSQPQQNNQFVNSGSMNNYFEQQQSSNNSMFNQQQQPQMQMAMQAQHQHHPQQASQHQLTTQQHLQQQQQQQHQHHLQYQQTGQQHQNQHGPPHQTHMQPQQIRLSGHQQHQQSMNFQQQMQQHQHPQQQIFAPQQAAGHSRPALTAMLHQKLDNKMHPRFNFG